ASPAGSGTPPFLHLLVPDHRFDVVPVRIQDERSIPVLIARSRSAVVLSAGRHRRPVEGVDGGSALRVESDVRRGADLALRHPEVVAPALDESESIPVPAVHLVSERLQRPLVEFPARARIAAAKADVLDHPRCVRRTHAPRNLNLPTPACSDGRIRSQTADGAGARLSAAPYTRSVSQVSANVRATRSAASA